MNSNAELISVSARNDIFVTIDTLATLHEKLALYSFDSIQIYRGGIDLLRIVKKDRNVNRSAYIELNDYRRRLMSILSQKSNKGELVLLALSILGLVAALIWRGKAI